MSCGLEWQGGDRTIAKLKKYIKDRLGCDVIGVELTDSQLELAIHDAEEYWQMWIGRVREVDMQNSGDRHTFQDTEIATDVDSVVDVFFSNEGGVADFYGWADVEINPFQYTYNGIGGYSMINQYQMYRKMARQVMSSDHEWAWDRAARQLILSPANTPIGRFRVIYLSRCFDYQYLASYEWHLFRDYAYARSMRTLAHIRMKFSEKPSATGSISMDGDAMWANAEAIEMSVEEKMRNMQRPTGIIVG